MADLPTIELVDVEAQDAEGKPVIVKRVKRTIKQADHIEYASKEQLEAIKAQLQEKITEIDRNLALFE